MLWGSQAHLGPGDMLRKFWHRRNWVYEVLTIFYNLLKGNKNYFLFYYEKEKTDTKLNKLYQILPLAIYNKTYFYVLSVIHKIPELGPRLNWR
jgi:hypothetical protein